MKNHTHILVTGGTGFLGRSLVERLVQQGERVRVLGRRLVVRWRHNKLIEHIRADITEAGVIEAALRGIDQVYHLAAATQEKNWAAYQAATVDASARLLDCFAAQGGGRMVFVSSLIVYDSDMMRDGLVINEDFPLGENLCYSNNYARAKMEAERLAQTYLAHPLIKLTIVRPGIIYGPGLKKPLNGVAFNIKGKLLVLLGKGDKSVPLIYLDDVAHALVEVMRNERSIGCIYNLVHPEIPTQNEYLALYQKLSGDKRPSIRIPKKIVMLLFSFTEFALRVSLNRKSHLRRKAARAMKQVDYSSERLREDTCFEPSVSFHEGMHKMLNIGTNDS
jgi:nucleoside-diphosphate-sugar epimerase